MNQGTKQSSLYLRRVPLLALALALPVLSMTREVAIEPPPPSDSQCALIEVHDTTGIGWWSSAAVEISSASVEDGGT
ncbi:MAG: hypothetical protein M3023_06490 [Pseudomonadota bacterium]|nr:hypothetical protein [Pseudomonadota bacterium]